MPSAMAIDVHWLYTNCMDLSRRRTPLQEGTCQHIRTLGHKETVKLYSLARRTGDRFLTVSGVSINNRQTESLSRDY